MKVFVIQNKKGNFFKGFDGWRPYSEFFLCSAMKDGKHVMSDQFVRTGIVTVKAREDAKEFVTRERAEKVLRSLVPHNVTKRVHANATSALKRIKMTLKKIDYLNTSGLSTYAGRKEFLDNVYSCLHTQCSHDSLFALDEELLKRTVTSRKRVVELLNKYIPVYEKILGKTYERSFGWTIVEDVPTFSFKPSISTNFKMYTQKAQCSNCGVGGLAIPFMSIKGKKLCPFCLDKLNEKAKLEISRLDPEVVSAYHAEFFVAKL